MLNSMKESKLSISKTEVAVEIKNPKISTHSIGQTRKIMMRLGNSSNQTPNKEKIKILMKEQCIKDRENPKNINQSIKIKMLKFQKACLQVSRITKSATVEAPTKKKIYKEESLLKEKPRNSRDN